MEQIQKEKEEKVDVQKSTEKKMKFYMVLSFVFGLSLSFVIANLIVGCDDRAEVNNTVRYTNVGRAINGVMQEKETVAGMKVDRVVKQGLDSIGIFEKDEKRGFYNHACVVLFRRACRSGEGWQDWLCKHEGQVGHPTQIHAENK